MQLSSFSSTNNGLAIFITHLKILQIHRYKNAVKHLPRSSREFPLLKKSDTSDMIYPSCNYCPICHEKFCIISWTVLCYTWIYIIVGPSHIIFILLTPLYLCRILIHISLYFKNKTKKEASEFSLPHPLKVNKIFLYL
jgi:hypothetical protein